MSGVRLSPVFYRATRRNQPAHLPSMGPFVQLLPRLRQKSARRRGPGPFVPFFIVSRAEISTPKRPAHLPSLVRANERGPFVPIFTVPRAEISTPDRRSFAFNGVRLYRSGWTDRMGRVGRTGRRPDLSTDWSDSSNSSDASDFV